MRLGVTLVKIAAFLAPMALTGTAIAEDDQMTTIPVPPQAGAIVLGTGALRGATTAESWYRQYGKNFVRNVSIATLTPFLPDPAKSTGTAVVIAPGGGFRTLSMENEGSDVARALAARGIAAFLLKYRLVPTPADQICFEKSMSAIFKAADRSSKFAPSLAPQLVDVRAAFALIRKRSANWSVDPHRIGMVGFSAGAMLTLRTALGGGDAQPAFIGIIYGPLDPVAVPVGAPPMFVALAADDPIFGGRSMGLVQSWIAAKRPVEFHLYEQGGHGFGMYQKTTTSTGWFEQFVRWLAMHGMLGER